MPLWVPWLLAHAAAQGCWMWQSKISVYVCVLRSHRSLARALVVHRSAHRPRPAHYVVSPCLLLLLLLLPLLCCGQV